MRPRDIQSTRSPTYETTYENNNNIIFMRVNVYRIYKLRGTKGKKGRKY